MIEVAKLASAKLLIGLESNRFFDDGMTHSRFSDGGRRNETSFASCERRLVSGGGTCEVADELATVEAKDSRLDVVLKVETEKDRLGVSGGVGISNNGVEVLLSCCKSAFVGEVVIVIRVSVKVSTVKLSGWSMLSLFVEPEDTDGLCWLLCDDMDCILSASSSMPFSNLSCTLFGLLAAGESSSDTDRCKVLQTNRKGFFRFNISRSSIANSISAIASREKSSNFRRDAAVNASRG